MDLVENRFGKTWKHFLEVLKVDYNCSLADVCRDQHTTFGGVSVSAILSCRPFFILIFLLCIKMKHYGFSRKSIWKNLETFP
ncbi:hypothetical protein F3D28_18720 [Bacteroides ovatus]|nr:hypothetical protein F3D28_18720 [Bacteroides ovatus]